MDSRQKTLTLFLAMLGLLGFHLWLLSRTVARGDVFLSGLLLVAMGLFSWRTVHYWGRFRGTPESPAGVDSPDERRRIRNWSLLLVGLLVLHGWLFATVLSLGDVFFGSALALAMAIFVYRLGSYGVRYAQLRRAGPVVEDVPLPEPSKGPPSASSDQEPEKRASSGLLRRVGRQTATPWRFRKASMKSQTLASNRYTLYVLRQPPSTKERPGEAREVARAPEGWE